MASHNFIRCRHCDAIHPITPFDKSPIYTLKPGGVEETQTDDWRQFMQQHANHKLEPLKATGEKYFTSGSVLDPMSVAYVEVTDGHDQFLLRRSRKSIEEPLKYELVQARIVDAGLLIEVQGDEIKKEMKYHFRWAPAPTPDDDRIDLFIGLLKEAVKGIDPNTVQITEVSYLDDCVSYGRLDQEVMDGLMMKCAGYFLPTELESLLRFFEKHCDGCDVMTLVLRRQVSVEHAAV